MKLHSILNAKQELISRKKN